MTVENCTLAIKIDIDTLKGYRERLPRLLDSAEIGRASCRERV